MDKFDISCGLTKKQIDSIKFAAKNAISGRLPRMPEPIEMKLFFQGRDAWVFSWGLCAQPSIGSTVSVSLEIVVKLKNDDPVRIEEKHPADILALTEEKGERTPRSIGTDIHHHNNLNKSQTTYDDRSGRAGCHYW
nr:hypothetical protein [Desulfobulbaceae bacterium]